MPANSAEKNAVRARMARTDENYTTALTAVRAMRDPRTNLLFAPDGDPTNGGIPVETLVDLLRVLGTDTKWTIANTGPGWNQLVLDLLPDGSSALEEGDTPVGAYLVSTEVIAEIRSELGENSYVENLEIQGGDVWTIEDTDRLATSTYFVVGECMSNEGDPASIFTDATPPVGRYMRGENGTNHLVLDLDEDRTYEQVRTLLAWAEDRVAGASK